MKTTLTAQQLIDACKALDLDWTRVANVWMSPTEVCAEVARVDATGTFVLEGDHFVTDHICMSVHRGVDAP